MNDHNDPTSNNDGQSGIDRETELRNRENETGQQSDQQSREQSSQQGGQQSGQQSGTPTEPTTGESGFVGSGGDQSSDYLTKGENEDFQPEDQSDTSTGTADVETGQPTSQDSTLDDGADTSR